MSGRGFSTQSSGRVVVRSLLGMIEDLAAQVSRLRDQPEGQRTGGNGMRRTEKAAITRFAEARAPEEARAALTGGSGGGP